MTTPYTSARRPPARRPVWLIVLLTAVVMVVLFAVGYGVSLLVAGEGERPTVVAGEEDPSVAGDAIGNNDGIAGNDDVEPEPCETTLIAAAEVLATYPVSDAGQKHAIEVLLANADPTVSSAYHAVSALNALEHQPQRILEPYKPRILKLPTKDPDVPGRPNGYAGRMHQHISSPIPDYFSWEKGNR